MATDTPRALWFNRERDRTCGFSKHPDDAPCGAQATVHGIVDGPYSALFACVRHEPHLVRNADWHHPAVSACFHPRARFTWDDLVGENFCYVPDEPAELQAVGHASGTTRPAGEES